MNNIKIITVLLVYLLVVIAKNASAEQDIYEQYKSLENIKQEISIKKAENSRLEKRLNELEVEHNNFLTEKEINNKTINKLQRENKHPAKLATSLDNSILKSKGWKNSSSDTYPPEQQINILNIGKYTENIFAYKWDVSQSGTRGMANITKSENNKIPLLTFTFESTYDKENYGTIHLLLQKNPIDINNSYKISFKYKGNKNNAKSFFSLVIVWVDKNSGKWISSVSHGIYMQDEQWKTACLDLKNDFDIPNTVTELIMVKFVINSNVMSKGHKAILQLKDWEILEK